MLLSIQVVIIILQVCLYNFTRGWRWLYAACNAITLLYFAFKFEDYDVKVYRAIVDLQDDIKHLLKFANFNPVFAEQGQFPQCHSWTMINPGCLIIISSDYCHTCRRETWNLTSSYAEVNCKHITFYQLKCFLRHTSINVLFGILLDCALPRSTRGGLVIRLLGVTVLCAVSFGAHIITVYSGDANKCILEAIQLFVQ